MKNSLPFQDSYYWNLSLYASLSPCHRRIINVLATAFEAHACGNHKKSHWSRKRIAQDAKCSVGEVSRCLSKYKEFILTKIHQPKVKGLDGKWKYLANELEFNDRFFTLVFFLKKSGYAKYWHLHKDRLIAEVQENEELALHKIGYDFEVVNTQCAHGRRLKTHTSVLGIPTGSKEEYLVPTKSKPVPAIPKKTKTASEAIQVPGLSVQCKAHLDRFGSLFLVQEINSDYKFNLDHGRRLRNPDHWVKSRLVDQMKYQYKVLKGAHDHTI